MGALEEGGKALGTVAETMKGAPLVLALVLINIMTIAFAVYIMHEVGETIRQRNETNSALLKNILDECLSNRPRASIYFRSAKDRAATPVLPLPKLDPQPQKLDQLGKPAN